mmetsp:Transcript_18567/g.28070  ORF Transcript_18567/g.28070 Transcript_18567/m.28070 type:complete len:268 (+) Transcript_18567:96-899(+)
MKRNETTMMQSFRRIFICLSLPQLLLIVALLHSFVPKTSSFISPSIRSRDVISPPLYSTGPRFRTVEEMNGGSSSYVPDGLTADQYREMKQEEEKELSKKNFGAWGPRFNRSNRPEGDWMVVPSLWTNGFQAQQSNSINNRGVSPNNIVLRLIARGTLLLREYIPSFIVSTAAWLAFVSATIAIRQTSVASLSALVRTTAQTVLQKNVVMKLSAAIVLSVIPVQKLFLERVNRRYLWSSRRSVLTSTMVSLVSLALCFGLCSVGLLR